MSHKFITDANEIGYDNSVSGLTATDVQAAIDEVNSKANSLVTLTGLAAGSTDFGAFSGSTLTSGETLKNLLQELETAVEAGAFNINALTAETTVDNANDLLAFYDVSWRWKSQDHSRSIYHWSWIGGHC